MAGIPIDHYRLGGREHRRVFWDADIEGGATVKELVTYVICGGIGALIGTGMDFRTLAVFPGREAWHGCSRGIGRCRMD